MAPGALALLLTPGASANRNQSALVAIDEAASALGIAVDRIDFPYTKAGRRSPDRPPVLVAAVEEGAAALAARTRVAPDAVVVGGRSMGGRICSMAVAEGMAARALVLVSYPLHPPGRPDKPRTEHFPRLTVPCLFVSGTRDSFAAREELEEATAAIPGPVTHVWLDGGDHGLRRRDAETAETVASWMALL